MNRDMALWPFICYFRTLFKKCVIRRLAGQNEKS